MNTFIDEIFWGNGGVIYYRRFPVTKKMRRSTETKMLINDTLWPPVRQAVVSEREMAK